MWTGAPGPSKLSSSPIHWRTRPFLYCPHGLSATRLGHFAPYIHLPGLQPKHRPSDSVSASTKEAPAAIVSYTVQKGETLWDVAVQHGVSMRTIKELNKLTGAEPVLTEGQQLLVPASGITAVAAAEDPAAAAALGSTPARGLWAGSEHIRLATVAEAKQLYLRQCVRGNSQNTLLVLYAPWCPHCRDMEDELERLAEGLSHVSALRVVAVNADCTEGRMFSREVLGVAYYPSIIAFPEHTRTFYKYKGRQRDAESLLRFINMTCCAREDMMWLLRPTGTHAVAVAGGQSGPLRWATQWVPVGTSPSAMAAAVGIMLAAAVVGGVWMTQRRRPDRAEAEVVAELDSSLGRMAQLMVRAVGTRMALLVGLIGGREPTQDASAPPQPAAAAAQDSESPPRITPVVPSSAAGVAPQPAGPGVVVAAATVVAGSSLDDAATGAGVAVRELTAEERMRLTRLTDDELIALVNSDPDLDKVLSRLLGDK